MSGTAPAGQPPRASLIALLAEAESTCVLELDERGAIVDANPCLARLLGCGALEGRSLFDLLDPDSVGEAERLLASAVERSLLTFSDGGLRVGLACRLLQVDGRSLFLAEPVAADRALERSLFELNNELAVLAREHARQRAELEEAVEARRKTEWTLRRLGEVLPVCMSCKRVDDGSPEWSTLVEFLFDNDVQLSHGYCPTCSERELAQLNT